MGVVLAEFIDRLLGKDSLYKVKAISDPKERNVFEYDQSELL